MLRCSCLQNATTRTASAEDLVRSLYRLGFVQREIARHAAAELGGQGFASLAAIHTDGPLRPSGLAQRLGLDLSVVSRQVTALVDAGYVAREADPADGRAQVLTSTPAGVDALRTAHGRMVEAFASALGDWDDEEVRTLAADLDRLRKDFEQR